MRQKGNNKWQTQPLKKKIKSTHFSSHGQQDQEERGSNCTVRYFDNKVKFVDNEEFTTLELPMEGVEGERKRENMSFLKYVKK